MLFCLVFALFGCEKVGEEEFEMVENKQWEEYGVMPDSQFGYKMADPSGFERHPLIDKLSDSTRVVIKEGLVLMYNPNQGSSTWWGIRVLYRPDLSEEAVRLSEEIMACGSTISRVVYPQDSDNSEWLAGVKNGKGWIGKADRKTRKVTNEWTDGKVVEQDIKVDLGYGNYRTVHMDRMRVSGLIKNGDNYIVATAGYNYRNALDSSGAEVWYNLYILSDNKTITIPLKHLAVGGHSIDIFPWYKNSFLVSQTSGNYDCYSLDGELMDSFKDDPFLNTRIKYPCSYSEYIEISGSWIHKRNLKYPYSTSEATIWAIPYEPLSQIASDAKVTHTLLSSNTNLWEFKVDVLNFDGSKKSFTFKVNIDSGEITD